MSTRNDGMRLGDLEIAAAGAKIFDSILPGGLKWDTYIKKPDANCLASCPYGRCRGNGPKGLLCSTEWRKTPVEADGVFPVLRHVFANFDHYDRGDSGETALSASFMDLKEFFVADVSNGNGDSFPEGELKWRIHRYRERNSQEARALKDEALRCRQIVCAGCDKDYFGLFGEQASAIVECHHTIPLSSARHTGVTERKDLRLLCANCHRLTHSRNPALEISELRKLNGAD